MDISAFISGLNIVDIIILAILLLSIVSGMYKGFISSLLATLGFAGAAVAAYYVCPKLAQVFQSNNGLMNSMSYYLDAPSMLKSFADTAVSQAASNTNALSEAASNLSGLPASIVEAFRDNVLGQIFNTLNLSSLGDYLSQTVIVALVYVISFLLIFAACYILALLIVNLLNNVFHFPLLRHLDWLLGGVLGFARGALITALVITVVPMLLSIMELNIADEFIQSSQLAHFFSSDAIIKNIIALGFTVKG